LKADVLDELPSKRRQRIQLEVKSTLLPTCLYLKQEYLALGEEDRDLKRQKLMELYNESAQAKMGPVCEYVEDLLSGGCKFLVFAHHLAMLDALEAVCIKNKVGFIRIDGSVSATDRVKRVSQFQADQHVRVAVLGICAAGVGITLTAASTVVFAELHWTPGIIVQAEDRAHRIGQKCSVNVHFLLAYGTIDDIMWPSIAHKVEVVSAMCDGRRDQLNVENVSARDAAMDAGDAACEAFTNLDNAVDDFMSACAIPQATSAGPGAPVPLVEKSPTRSPVQSPQRAENCACKPTGTVLSLLQASEHPKLDAASQSDMEDPIECASDVEPEQAKTSKYSFCVSRPTGRLHVLDVDGNPLGRNVKIADWEALKNRGSFSKELLTDEEVVKEVEMFLWEWVALRPIDHRHLMDSTVHLPLSKFLPQKKKPIRVKKPPKEKTPTKVKTPKASATVIKKQKKSITSLLRASCAWCGEAEPELHSAFCSPSCEAKAGAQPDADNGVSIEDEPAEVRPVEE